MSVTVVEEVDANQMLAEMARVTKPGGRVAVIARALDRPFLMNLSLPPDLKSKVEAPWHLLRHGLAIRSRQGVSPPPVVQEPHQAEPGGLLPLKHLGNRHSLLHLA